MEDTKKIIQGLIEKTNSDKIVWRKGLYKNFFEYKAFKVFKGDFGGMGEGSLYFQGDFIVCEKELCNSIGEQIIRKQLQRRQNMFSKMKRILNIK